MCNHKFAVLLAAMAFPSVLAWAGAEPIVLVAPPDYQVLAISPNGKWATGIFSDYSYAQRGFLWNLESNTFELLSTSEESNGWSVADDGTVCGSFTDHTTSEIGAGTMMPGYYRDGEWHSVEVPQGFTGPSDNYHGAGQGYAITPDGTTMTGALYIEGQYTPAVWHEGQLVQLLDISNDGMQGGAPYCISPDGTLVGGWAYRYNRSNAIWNLVNNTRAFISSEESPWASVNRFSPDGKKAIYGGGWDMSVDADNDTQYYYSIYDVETGEVTSLPSMNKESTVSLFAISNSYTCVGSTGDYDGGRAVIYPNGQGPAVLMEDYLSERGVNFDELGLLVHEELGYRVLFRAQDISADDNIFALLGYNDQGLCSIIVMLNQDSQHAAPIEIKVRQLSGIPTTEISWSAPVRANEGIKAYRIYRNEEMVAEVGKNTTTYYDPSLAYSSYKYSVATVYEDGTEMLASAPAVNVEPQAIARPEGLFARQKGVYSIVSQWSAPGTNLVNKSWYSPATANLRGFGIALDGQTIELGIGFKREEMANYAGYSIAKVNFYPMSEQEDWTLNIYQYEGETPVRIYSQPITQELVYKQRNSVVLDEPLPVPTEGDLVVAIEVTVPYASMSVIGMDHGHYTPGFSDLLRLSTEPDLYSYYYNSLAYGVPDYASFMIDAVLVGEGQDLSADEVAGYRLSLDGEEVCTTTEMEWKSAKVSAQNHVLALQAIYANGNVSDPVTTEINVAYDYKTIDDVDITTQGTAVNLEWQAPVDDDITNITYAHGSVQAEGIIGPAENNYGIMAGVEYGQSLLKGYQGYEISSLRFFPLSDATFTFLLFDDVDQIAEIPVDDYELYTWNTVKLDEPITINENTSYFLVLDCYDVDPEMPALGLDNRLPIALTSDLISLDGESWSSVMMESGLSGNWMIGMNIVDPEAQLLPVDGYDVRIDNSKVASKINDTAFSYDLAEKADGEHTLRVNTYYTGRATAVNGALLNFVINASGIGQLHTESYRLTREMRTLSVEGADVREVSVFATDGALMARADGNKVSIESLAAGVYMVKAATPSGALTYKIVIE